MSAFGEEREEERCGVFARLLLLRIEEHANKEKLKHTLRKRRPILLQQQLLLLVCAFLGVARRLLLHRCCAAVVRVRPCTLVC